MPGAPVPAPCGATTPRRCGWTALLSADGWHHWGLQVCGDCPTDGRCMSSRPMPRRFRSSAMRSGDGGYTGMWECWKNWFKQMGLVGGWGLNCFGAGVGCWFQPAPTYHSWCTRIGFCNTPRCCGLRVPLGRSTLRPASVPGCALQMSSTRCR